MEHQSRRREFPSTRPPSATIRADANRVAGESPSPGELGALTPEAVRQLVHELRVHQIELEMQNEELRRAQAEQQAAEARYFDLYDRAPVGYVTLDEEDRILDANLAAVALLGGPRSRLLSQPLSRFVAPESQDSYYLYRRQLAAVAEPQSCELRLEKPDGRDVWVRMLAARVVDSEGKAGYRITLSDITERRKTERRLRESETTLQQQVHAGTQQLRRLAAELVLAEDRERRALAEMLHDNLAQLLAAARIKLTLIEPDALEPSLRGIDGLLDEAERLTRTVIQQLSPQTLRTMTLGQNLRILAGEIERNFGVAVHVHDDTAPRLLGEVARTLVYRATRELLINVAKHAGVRSAELSCAVQDDELVVAVSDEGCGFDPSRVESAFSEAAGYGLFSIRERLSAIGGRFDVHSAPGEGSTVVLSLPIGAARAAERGP